MLRYRTAASWILLVVTAAATHSVDSTRGATETLFSLSYGTRQGEVRWKPMSADGEFDDERPLLFRRLRNGDFLILSKIADRLLVQIFTQTGQPRNSYTIDRSYLSLADVYATSEGTVYCLSQLNTDVSEANPILQMYDTEGKPTAVVKDELLSDTLKQLQADFVHPLSLKVEEKSGDVFFLVHSSDKTAQHWIRVRPRSESVDILPNHGWITRDVDGLLLLRFSPESYLSPIQEVEASALDGTTIAKFPVQLRQLPRDLLFFRENFVISPDKKFIVIEAFGNDHEEKDDQSFLVRYLGIYDRDGKEILVLRTTVLGGRMWDVDSEFNLYYLHFTDRGVEARKLRITRPL